MDRSVAPVALVSGASRGIGRGCALALAEGGFDVVVNYLSHEAEAAEVVREVERAGRRGLAFRADVSDRARVDAMVAAGLDRFGRLDAVVANAYRSVRQPFLDVTADGLEQTLAVTLLGAFHVCQAGARAMVETGAAGSITVIGSIHGEAGFSNSTSYNIAKFGLTGLVLTAANELAAHRIRVNLVNPGWIDTPGERRYATEEELRAGAERLPWRRLGQPHEIGRVVAFLASEGASFVSGAVLRADGAQIAALGG
jgi:glucose 1-dehydrogenase